MVGVGGGEVVLRITGVQKRRQKSCLWTGLIHRGEEGTKLGYKKMKRSIKSCLGTRPNSFFFPLSPRTHRRKFTGLAEVDGQLN